MGRTEGNILPLEFRVADLDDIQEIWDLYSVVVMRASGTDEDPYWVMGEHPSMKELEYQLEDGVLYVATLYGEIVAVTVIEQAFVSGYDTFKWQSGILLRDSAVMRMFAVSPHFRGQKISERFLDYCIAEIRNQGYKAIRLDVMPHLKHAQNLYMRHGFKNLGVVKLGHKDPRMQMSTLFELVL
ncbi:MAG: GNAT family N-acetyltransferase [Anaerotardibacter sp.]